MMNDVLKLSFYRSFVIWRSITQTTRISSRSRASSTTASRLVHLCLQFFFTFSHVSSSVVDPDPDSIRSLDPDPDSESGSGSGSRGKKVRKKKMFIFLKKFLKKFFSLNFRNVVTCKYYFTAFYIFNTWKNINSTCTAPRIKVKIDLVRIF